METYTQTPFESAMDEGRKIAESVIAANKISAERTRLEREVIEAAVEEYKMEHAADHGSNTITRTEALIKMQMAMKAKREAVAALLEFESLHGNQK